MTTLAVLISLLSLAAKAESQENSPNFVFLLVDDLRWDAPGFMGHPFSHTPNLDRLAEDGTVFENAFCTTSICATSRATFLTGQWASRHGIVGFRQSLSPEAFAETFPAILRSAGYHVGFVGKWGLGGKLPEDQYDYWRGFPGQGRYFSPDREEHLTTVLANQAVDFLRDCPKDQPFCLQVSFKAVHCQDSDPWQFQPDPKYSSLFEDVTIPLAESANEEAFARLPAFLRESEARKRWHVRFGTPEIYRKSVRDYFRLLAGIDETVGRIGETLRSMGRAGETVTVFTSDNGFYFGEHGLAGKWFPHEESIRIPMMLHDPRIEGARRRVDEPVLSVDVAPTLLALAGIPAPERMQGECVLPLLEEEADEWREWFYEHRFVHPRIPQCEAVRARRWKYVRYFHPTGEGSPDVEQLYDLAEDPSELRDLAQDPSHAERLEAMRSRWKELREAAR